MRVKRISTKALGGFGYSRERGLSADRCCGGEGRHLHICVMC